MDAIPRIIHQSWKTAEIPERWKPLQRTWREHHPDWEYRFWTDEDGRAFVRDHYAGFLATYDRYPQGINRAEVVRYLVMQHYGGVYVDLDFECLRPVDPLLEGQAIVLGLEPPAHARSGAVRQRGLDHLVCNAFLASTPRHPFWDHVLACLVGSENEPNVLDATGVFLLTRACDSFPSKADIRLLPSQLLYPIEKWDRSEREPANDRVYGELVKTAYAIHYWHGSWWREAVLNAARRRVAESRRVKRSDAGERPPGR